MTERKARSSDSVDLTEDEASSESNGDVDSPFHFVDCSNFANEPFPKPEPIREPNTSAPLPASLKNHVKIAPKIITDPNIIKKSGVDGKPVETVCLDSDTEHDPSNQLSVPPPLLYKTNVAKGTREITLPQTNTIYSPKQPPGKVVVIKKNNKYYKIIIPHNVMPNINQSMGPVLINIPEVGPLVISNDPQATKAEPQQLSLNLDAVEQSRQPSVKGTSFKDIMLRDKKFCWTFNVFRKRDLDGFSYTDRLGFNKAEVQKARKCERTMSLILNKQITKLSSAIKEYETFKRSLQKKNKVKLVKINSIIQGKSSAKDRLKSEPNFVEVNEEMSNNATDDLLITKKVVILNETEPVPVKNRRGRPKSKILKNDRKNFNIKPCSVQIVKDQVVEKAYKKYCNELRLNVDVQTVRESKMVHNSTTFRRKVIKTEERLRKEIDVFKPFLILTEHNINFGHSLKYYEDESAKTNILHVVGTGKTFSSTILNAWGFVSAVKMNYVKLVNANVFSKFVKDGMQFKSDVSHCRAEHNYSYVSQ